jgi:DNA-directed RNA polymerase specialized sigma24 family protein
MTPSEDITVWVERLKVGDRDAAQKLWEHYFRRLVGLARKKLGSLPRRAADEEDVALSAFNSFCQGAEQGRFPRLDDRHDLWRLLVLLTVRKAADLQEHEGRACRAWHRLQEAAGSGLSPLDDLISTEPEPAFAAEVAEECRILLGALDDDTWRSVALWKLEGYTNREIADRLGCSVSAVERKLSFIRNAWEDHPGIDGRKSGSPGPRSA